MASNSGDAFSTRQHTGHAANYAQLRMLFDECVDLPEGERLAFIEQHVPDEAMRMELTLMLAQDESSTDPFEAAPLQKLGDLLADDFAALPDLIGSHCGSFKLVRLLGSGGQGAVYLGERDDGEFVQQAAVKLLREAILDAADLRRFRRERDILARFSHAGVARLIDAGLGEFGLPYLAMEYVNGQPLDHWCAQRNASRAVRLELFAQLCEVAAAAHRQLIVHRDLKPSNVMVDGDGQVKVLDFGIARLIDEDAANRTDALMLTPGYGAPEQRSGDTPTPASDVFALGVLLRELIAGQSPPSKPGDSWPAWPLDVSHELRWVFERCCEEEPARRYRDAAELLEDIENFRAQRPLRAHPPSNWYRARKFVARHRGGVSLTALLLLTTLIGFGMALWQTRVAQLESARAMNEAQRARAALARTKAVRDFVVEVFETGGAGLPADQIPDTATLLESGRRTALAASTKSPEIRADMLTLLGRIYLGLQREKQALELQDEAVTLLESQAPRNDIAYASALSRRGELQSRLGNPERAFADFDAALALQQQHDPDGLGRLETLRARGEALAFVGRIEPALADFEQALALVEPRHDTPKSLLAEIHNSFGVALWRSDDCARGEPHLRQSVAMARQAWGNEHAATAGALSALSLCLTHSAQLQESETVSRESLSILERVYGKNHPALGQSKNNLANLLIKRGRFAEALPLLREKLDADRASGVDQAGSGLNTWINLSNVLRNLGDLGGAEGAAKTALGISRRVAPESPVGREPELLLARVALDRADPALAQQWVDSYRGWMKTPEGAHALMPGRVDFLEARIAIAKGDGDRAERLTAVALEQFDKLRCNEVSPFAASVASWLQARGREGEAMVLLDRAIAHCEKLGELQHFAAGGALLARATLRLAAGDRSGANADMEQAESVLASALPANHPQRLKLASLRQRFNMQR